MSNVTPVSLGNYLLLEKIAVGGVTQLFRAKVTGVKGFEKILAIKIILPQFSGEKELVKAFIDEAKLAAQLNHPNIVQIYDFGLWKNSFFIAMEYLLGKDLRNVFSRSREKRTPLRLENVLYIICQICSGLDYAHKLSDIQGNPLHIIHRDINPKNILITYEGEVKIVDFGVAKAASQITLSQDEMIKEKVAYMSPEQAAGGSIDHRSDIFSMGILLYEMLTQKPMYAGDAWRISAKARQAEFEPPEVAISGLSSKIYKVLHKSLAKEINQRYQSCADMLADIEMCMLELSERPTFQGLSEYMKRLFRSEIEAKELILGEIATAGLDTETKLRSDLQTVEGILEKAEGSIGEEELSKRKRGRIYYAVLAVALTVVGVVWAFGAKDKSLNVPGRNESQPSLSQPSQEKAPAKVALSEETSKREERTQRQGEGKALENKAVALIERNPKEAQSLLLRAVELDPKSVRAHFHLGSTYLILKDSPKAIEAYQRVIDLNPKLTDAYFNLGYIYALNEEYSKAEEMYGQVVKMAPPYLDDALYNLGLVQEKQGKREESMVNLGRALQVNPQNKVAQKLLNQIKGDS